jgi:hypothetical protein
MTSTMSDYAIAAPKMTKERPDPYTNHAFIESLGSLRIHVVRL